MNATAPPTANLPRIAPGNRVRVTQTIVGRGSTWATTVEGVVETCRAEATGSWYAHGKNDKLWLLRIRLRKDDGELSTLAIDHNSRVEVIAGAKAPAAAR